MAQREVDRIENAIRHIQTSTDIDPWAAEIAVEAMRKQTKTYVEQMPSAQPEQRYTKKELEIFKHGISLSLLSKRSSQHWHYDEDTATEIEFLERLYEKVSANMRGGQNE